RSLCRSCSVRPFGAGLFPTLTHGLRRGLHILARASRLKTLMRSTFIRRAKRRRIPASSNAVLLRRKQQFYCFSGGLLLCSACLPGVFLTGFSACSGLISLPRSST